jgi:hypothetical protein
MGDSSHHFFAVMGLSVCCLEGRRKHDNCKVRNNRKEGMRSPSPETERGNAMGWNECLAVDAPCMREMHHVVSSDFALARGFSEKKETSRQIKRYEYPPDTRNGEGTSIQSKPAIVQ